MLPYKKELKPLARKLRNGMTEAEQQLWSKLRRKQVLGLQFYRQKPLAGYITDFYCASANLVIELDGSQHFEPAQKDYDSERTKVLETLGLRVLRFTNDQILRDIDQVMELIYRVALGEIPPNPPFSKGGTGAQRELSAVSTPAAMGENCRTSTQPK